MSEKVIERPEIEGEEIQASATAVQGPEEKDPRIKNIGDLLARREALDEGETYAILDAGRDVRVLSGVFRFDQADRSLYRGLPEEPLADVAPYLVRLEPDGRMLEWYLAEGWGDSWAVLLNSTAGAEALRNHFSGLISVETEDGDEVYFRFYDPRVLRTYLPICTAAEIERFFGPVRSFLMESEDGRSLLCYSRGEAGLNLESFPVLETGAESTQTVLEFVQPPEDAPRPQSGQALIIRCLQMEAFSEYTRRDFENRLIMHISEIIPAEAANMPEGGLRDRVRQAVDKALGYGIEAEEDVLLFVDFTFELGQDFEQTPEYDWALNILQDQRLPGHDKVQLIQKILAEQDPEEPESPFAASRVLARAAWAE